MSKTSKVKKSKKPKSSQDAVYERAIGGEKAGRTKGKWVRANPKRRSPGTYTASAVLTFRPSPEGTVATGRESIAEALAPFGMRPPTSKLQQAQRDFDAAQLQCVKACLAYATRAGFYLSPLGITAQDAGFALIDASAALLRARVEEQPIPVKLTPKGKTAKLKPFHAVPSRRRSK